MSRPRSLPVVDSSTGCDRRQLLLGLGLGALLAGCRTSFDDDGSGGELGGPDAGVATTEPPGGVAACDGGACLDLAHPENAALLEVDGSRVFLFEGRRLIVVRIDTTSFVALSAICTHAGAIVRYDASRMDIVCPRHGSRFSLDGDVTRSPAGRSLETFATTFDEATATLQIAI